MDRAEKNMPADFRALLGAERFGLRLVTGDGEDLLSTPILSAHSSDLPDPTPWLEPGGLLLTDGTQFLPPAAVDPRGYVRALAGHGLVALGFATHVVHDRIPPVLIDACRECQLPLIEVPRRTPFMGIIRFLSDAAAYEDRVRLERALAAQRSVARAALRPDGLTEILRELERNLDCWVALFDAGGSPIGIATRRTIPEEIVEAVTSTARRTLSRRRVAAVRLNDAGSGEATLQTIGRQGELRGVLAVGVGTGTLDRGDAALVESVIALASIALDQSRTLDDARRRLRAGILELLTAGLWDVARRTVGPLWGGLPAEPVRIASVRMGLDRGRVTEDDADRIAMMTALELLAEEHPGAIFFAEDSDELIVVAEADHRGDVVTVLRAAGAAAGFSAPASWAHFSDARRGARRAAERASQHRAFVDFDELAEEGLLGHLEQTHAHEVARRMLAPIDTGEETARDLRRALSVWLEHNGAWEPAAKALGIHRHTLRARVDSASRLLSLDLDTFGARAELWNALRLTEE